VQSARVFLSYARVDADRVAALEQGLRSFGADVWRDESLVGGHEWWDAILSEIRRRDVFVQAVSPTGLDSEACERERAYARALGKPIVPVVIDVVDTNALPDDLARLQLVLYVDPRPEHAFRLARALASCPPAPPLPQPLPDPPDVPVSYLHGLRARVRASSLALDEQLALIGRLEEALERDEERAAALELLRELNEREDLYRAAAKTIARLTDAGPPRQLPESGEEEIVEEPPAVPTRPHRGRLVGLALLVAVPGALIGGAIRELTTPEDAELNVDVLTLVVARTVGWALIVVSVAALLARVAGSVRHSRAVALGLTAGAAAGLLGAVAQGALSGMLDDADRPTYRLVGLAITGAIAGFYFGRSLRSPVAGLSGGLVGGIAAGALVYSWPGGGADSALNIVSWTVHAVPICALALGFAFARSRQLAPISEIAPGASALKV